MRSYSGWKKCRKKNLPFNILQEKCGNSQRAYWFCNFENICYNRRRIKRRKRYVSEDDYGYIYTFYVSGRLVDGCFCRFHMQRTGYEETVMEKCFHRGAVVRVIPGVDACCRLFAGGAV